MSKDLNLCQFIGRLGQDVELKYMPNGKAVANLSIACGDDYKNKDTGEKVQQTNWVRVVMFGRVAEVAAEYCRKGSQIYVSGKQVTRKWQNKDGQDQYTTEVIADNMQLLGGKGQTDSGQQEAPAAKDEGFDDDIPF